MEEKIQYTLNVRKNMSIIVDGIQYSLAHIRTQTFEKIQMESWRGDIFCKPVMVVYSNHCYSKKAPDGAVIAADGLVLDGKNRRKFDLTRYELSLGLPKILVAMLNSPSAIAWETGHGNRHYREIIASPNEKADVPYYIFMRINKVCADSGQKVIKLAVESAYPIMPPDPFPAKRGGLSIRKWLGKCWENKL